MKRQWLALDGAATVAGGIIMLPEAQKHGACSNQQDEMTRNGPCLLWCDSAAESIGQHTSQRMMTLVCVQAH